MSTIKCIGNYNYSGAINFWAEAAFWQTQQLD